MRFLWRALFISITLSFTTYFGLIWSHFCCTIDTLTLVQEEAIFFCQSKFQNLNLMTTLPAITGARVFGHDARRLWQVLTVAPGSHSSLLLRGAPVLYTTILYNAIRIPTAVAICK